MTPPPSDDQLALQPVVTARYEAGALSADFPPVAAAYAYRIDVTADTAEPPPLVYSTLLAAADATGTVELASDDFTARPGVTYTVTVTVLGVPSEPAAVTVVVLDAPVVTARAVIDGCALTWTAVPGATAYLVRVTDAAGATVVHRAQTDLTAATLTATDGLRPDTPYLVTVQARAGESYGPASTPVTAVLRSAAAILTALRDRLLAARVTVTDDDGATWLRYVLDTVTLPDDLPEDAARVRGVLTAATATGAAPFVSTAPDDPGPVLSEALDRLTLGGVSPAFGAGEEPPAEVVFTVSDDVLLRATWTTRPPDGWTPGDLFDALDGSGIDDLWLGGIAVVATTWEHTDAAVNAPLAVGLNLQATVAVRRDLCPADLDGLDPAGRIETVVGGPVALDDDGRPAFDWTTAADLGELVVRRVGLPDLPVTGERITLSCVPVPDPGDGPAVIARAAVGGGSTLGGDPIAVELTVATRRHPTVVLSALDPQVSRPSVSALLAATGVANTLPVALPATLLDLVDATVYRYELGVDPLGTEATSTVLTVGSDTAWTPAEGFGLKAPRLTLDLTTSSGWAATTYANARLTLGATLSLGDDSGDYAVTAVLSSAGPWYLSFDNDTDGTTDDDADGLDDGPTGPLPSLDTVAGFAGKTGASVLRVLPAELTAATGSLRLSRIWLLIDPDARAVRNVRVTLAQTVPWALLGDALTLSGWSCAIALDNDPVTGWDVSAQLDGEVTLTAGRSSTTVAVGVPLPLSAGLVRVELGEDQVVHLPTVGQLLGLLRGGPVNLPIGIATLGGLDVTRLLVLIDADAGAVTHLSFAFEQTGTWTIAENLLTVSDVTAAIAFQPSTSPIGVWGQIGATLEVVPGQPVDIATFKNEPDDVWRLHAASAHPIHLPSFAELAGWMAPAASRAALPAALPLSQGIDVRDVALRFGGPGGTLDQVAFRAEAEDVWTIVPGRLSLTDLDLSLTVPQPVVASQVTGSVGAVLTLGGVPIGLRAAKPDSAGPWTFTGEMIQGRALDVLALADGIGDRSDYALPADAVARDLPASVELVAASVLAVPDSGTFHAEGELGFDWEFAFAGTTVAVRSLSASLDVAATGKPLVVRLLGEFDVAGLRAAVGLTVGTQDTPAVLTGSVAPADLADVAVDTLADTLTSAAPDTGWSTLVPAPLTPPAFASARLYLDVTGSRLLLHGTVDVAGQSALDGFLYVARAAGPDPRPWTYAVAVSLGADFRMGALVPALAVVDDYLRVTDARLVICDLRAPTEADPTAGGSLGALATDSAALLALADPSAPAPLTGLGQDPLKLRAGAYLTARLRFGQVSLFDKLLKIGSADQFAELRLEALIDAADPVNTVYSADLPDLTVLDAVVLTHTDAYPGIHLGYRPADAHRFQLDGRIAFTGVFGAAPTFDVSLVVDDIGLTSTITQTQQRIAQPFGIPGVVLSGLGVDLRIVWEVPATASTPLKPQTSWAALRGHVLLGPAPADPSLPDNRPSVAAELALVGGVPALFDLSLDRDFSVGAFLAQCLTGSGANWPSDFIDIAFLSGSRISYYDDRADPYKTVATVDGHTFAAGFTVDAYVRLTLVTSLTLHGTVTVTRNASTQQFSDATAAFQLDDPIDLGFMSLAGTGLDPSSGLYAHGPSLGFTTGDHPALALTTGVNFLDAPFFQAGVNVREGSDGGNRFTGRLVAARPVSPFGLLGATFEYITHPRGADEFHLVDWPAFDWARNVIDFVQALRDLANALGSEGCGAIVQAIGAAACDADFTLTPSAALDGGEFAFSVRGTYALTFAGMDDPMVTADLPALTVRIPVSTTWDGLPDALASGMAGGARQVIEDLFTHPLDTVLFLVMLFGPSAAEVALDLVCEGLIDGVVAFACGVAAEIVADLGIGLGAAALLAVMVPAILYALAHGGDDDSGDPQDTTPRRPNVRPAAYAQGALTVTWDGAKYASGYTVQLLGPTGAVLFTADLGMLTTWIIPVDLATLGTGTFQVRVRGRRGDVTGDWGTLGIVRLAGPSPALTWSAGVLSAGWPAVTGATGYHVQLLAPDGTPLVDTQLAADATSVTAQVTEPAAGAYTALVTVLGGDLPPASGTPASLDVLSLATPAITAVSRDGDVFTVTWRPVAGAARYAVVLAADTDIATATVEASGELTARLSATAENPVTAAKVFSLSVRALATDHIGPWARQNIITVLLPAPADLTLSCDVDALSATFTGVNTPRRTPRYELELTRATGAADPGTVVGHVTDGVPGGTALPLDDGTTPTAGQRYGVRVRVSVEDPATVTNTGPWSDRADIVLTAVPPAPADTAMTVLGDQFGVSWTALTDQTDPGGAAGRSYDVQLVNLGPSPWHPSAVTPVASRTAVAGPSCVLTPDDGSMPPPGQIYDVKVRTRHGRQTGPWAPPRTAASFDRPTVTGATFAGNQVTVNWTPTAAPQAGYYVNLNYSNPDDPSVLGYLTSMSGAGGTTPAPQTVFDVTGLPRFADYLVSVRCWLYNDFYGPWSEPFRFPVAPTPTGLKLSYDGTAISASWDATPGATSYHLAVGPAAGGSTVASSTVQAPGTSTTFNTNLLQLGRQYMCGLVAQKQSAQGMVASPPVYATITLLGAPTGLTTVDDPGKVAATWTAVPGATGYQAQITDLLGRPVLTASTGGPGIGIDRSPLTQGANYLLQVRAVAEQPGPWSTAVHTTYGTFSTLCLGAPAGVNCNAGGVIGAFGDFWGKTIPAEVADNFHSTRATPRTGWVSVPFGQPAAATVLARLVAALRANNVLTEADAQRTFANVPRVGSAIGTGTSALCLGAPAGDPCRSPAGDFGAARGATASQLPSTYYPNGSAASGWVGVDGAFSGLPVLLRLVGQLAQGGRLTGNQPYDVFNSAMNVTVSFGDGGKAWCVRLGTPVGTVASGQVGDLMLNVSGAQLAGPYAPSAGWYALPDGADSIFEVLALLDVFLQSKGALPGTTGYDVFTRALGTKPKSGPIPH
ncbi:hypothetical protein ACFO3J_17735 [Streptomyces polygonati]|uniref:Fibronectin type-III domain-containing protein n=1 Tax=Streptomyces polygonati TaxID=1617087 RepID=A0ABV8HQW0_9ACTN